MNTTLPPLAFANRNAPVVDCATQMRNTLKSANIGLTHYEPVDELANYASKSSSVNVNSLPIIAVASTPVKFKATCNNKKIIIPFVGEGKFLTDGKSLQLAAGLTAVMLSNTSVSAVQNTRSVMIINYDEAKLAQITNGMLGLKADESVSLDYTYSRELMLTIGQLSFVTVFRNYASVINQLYSQPQLLNRFGLDDSIYSAIAMMAHPELFIDAINFLPSDNYDKRLLDRTCQYIQANLTQTITLSTLDQISNMSRRKLHYAFQHRYGCTPMQWVRGERLSLARSKLQHAEPWHTVTTIALSCGFARLSSFAQYYQLRFGELPSTTLARAFLS